MNAISIFNLKPRVLRTNVHEIVVKHVQEIDFDRSGMIHHIAKYSLFSFAYDAIDAADELRFRCDRFV